MTIIIIITLIPDAIYFRNRSGALTSLSLIRASDFALPGTWEQEQQPPTKGAKKTGPNYGYYAVFS